TKAVTPEPRRGHPAPRVAEFPGGMLNAVGLANPGLGAVRERELSWLAARVRRARVLVNVAGASIDDYARVIAGLTDLPVITAFEINASCPNTSAGGIRTAHDARQYLAAGASLVAIGTAALADPRVPERVARELERG